MARRLRTFEQFGETEQLRPMDIDSRYRQSIPLHKWQNRPKSYKEHWICLSFGLLNSLRSMELEFRIELNR